MSSPVSRASESEATSGALSITWLGHATVLVEIDGVRALTDPVLRDRVGPLVRIVPSVELAGSVDCVLLSHLHADHTDLPTLRALERCGPVLAPYPAREWLARNGLRDVRELHPGGEIGVGGLRISATAAVHDHRRRPFGPAAEPVGYVIRGSRAVYFAGDTDLFAGMAELRGAVDVALLPVWGWGASVGAGHLDPKSAAEAAALIAPAIAIPIHWGTFALARPARRAPDPERPAREFAELTKRYAPAVDVRVLKPGQRTMLKPGQPTTL
ncbi:MAG TPA: MBL fold metallo-hydrolase [Solirubrobacteraceae bacterium]|nr:MBL fold metallo-hydrolase [Solirubrobacteraceae bacterium]